MRRVAQFVLDGIGHKATMLSCSNNKGIPHKRTLLFWKCAQLKSRVDTAIEKNIRLDAKPKEHATKIIGTFRRDRVDTDLHFYAPQRFPNESLKSPGPGTHRPAFLRSTAVPERILEMAGTG